MTRTIERDETLGDLVTREPGWAQVFEQLQLDYCCGGRQTLADASAERGLDADTIIALLRATREDHSSATAQAHDFAEASIPELCDHIVEAHHGYLRRELPRIAELLATVVRVHGDAAPQVHDVQRVFESLRAALESHLAVEEEILFPAAKALGIPGRPAGVDGALLALHEDEHDDVGTALAALRTHSGGYDPDDAMCGTHRALLRALHELEIDIHQHVHEENNVLFARIRARLAHA